MAKYTGPSCKLCRREGEKLFLKGVRCTTDRCPFSRRSYSPGEHGERRKKLSDYGLQLREKQKVKRIYAILEKQFRIYFKRAERSKGITGEVLLQLLERRLDNVIFRLRFAATRKEARQLVSHGYVHVNGRKVNIPSYLVKAEDIIQIKCPQSKQERFKLTKELVKDRSLPSWLETDYDNLKATIIRLPQREDIQLPIQEQLIVELYSK
jgi:small subunit ribosomal protein S4